MWDCVKCSSTRALTPVSFSLLFIARPWPGVAAPCCCAGEHRCCQCFGRFQPRCSLPRMLLPHVSRPGGEAAGAADGSTAVAGCRPELGSPNLGSREEGGQRGREGSDAKDRDVQVGQRCLSNPPGEPLLFGGDTDGFSSLPAPHLLGECPRCCRGLARASRDLRWHGHRALLTGTRELRGDGADTAPWLPGPVRGSSWTTKARYGMEMLIACNGRWGVMPGRFGAGGDG